MFYLACPSCKKKVIEDTQGYHCERCQKYFNEAVPTYNFAFKVQDCTGSTLVQCLGESGEAILGMKATDFHAIHSDTEYVKAMAQALTWTSLKMTVRAKTDDYAGMSQGAEEEGPRIRYSVVRA